MTRAPGSKRRLRAIGSMFGACLSVVAIARLAVVSSVALPGCGGCLDASRVEQFTIAPAQPCLAAQVTGLCYGAGLAGTNSCAEPFTIATASGPMTIAAGAAFDLEPVWTVMTETGLLSGTDHYSITATIGTTPITITFDY